MLAGLRLGRHRVDGADDVGGGRQRPGGLGEHRTLVAPESTGTLAKAGQAYLWS